MGFPNCPLQLAKTSLRLIATAVVLFAMLGLAVASTACSKEAKVFPDMMGTVPTSTGHFVYWAVGDVNADEDLWSIYDRFKESAEVQQLGRFVPVLATVTGSARAVSYDNGSLMSTVALFRGDFDIKYIEGQLKTIGYSQTSRSGVGIWTLHDNQTIFKSVAMKSTTVFIGEASELMSCIDAAAKSSTQSLKGDPNIRLVTDKLPDGVIVEVDRADPSYGEQYSSLVAYGKSYTKASKDTLKLTAVYLFGDGPTAGAAQQQIMEDLAMTYEDVKVRRDQNFVIATSRISISDFTQTLDF